MLGQAGPEAEVAGPESFERARRRTRGSAVIAGVLWLVVAVVLIAPAPDLTQRLASGSAIVISCLGLAAACFSRYREGVGRRQVAWMLWTVSAGAGAYANAWVMVVGSAADVARFTPDAIATGLALVLAVTGFAFFTSTTRTGFGLGRMILDGVVLGGSVILIAQDLLQPGLLRWIETPLTDPIALLTPIIDLVVATIAGLQFLRVGRDERPAMGLGCLGFAAFAVSDLSVAFTRIRGDFQLGSILDLGTLAGFLLLTIGVSWPVAPLKPGSNEESHRSHVRGTVFTFGVFVAAATIHLAFGEFLRSPLSTVLVVVVLLAVAARQVLLIFDNERLRRGLEQRVRDRNIELREVTQRTDLLVDSVGDGIYGVDSGGMVTFLNPAAARVLGYRPRELMGRSAHEIFHSLETPTGTADAVPAAGTGLNGSGPAASGSEHAPQDCYISLVIASGEAATAVEDTYRAKDGRRFPVEVTASPLARDVRARGAVIVFRDVTHRREVDRLKTEFVSMVSHELKTPLTAIRGSLGLLAGGALGSLATPAKRMVEIAMDSSERLTRLINQILDLEKIESGVLPMSVGHYRSADLAADALEQVEGLARQHQVQIQTVSVEGTVLADRDQVVQTLLNLIGNAIKFSPPHSEIQVGAAMTGSYVEFWVADQGRGLPPDQLEQVFVRFHQVDSSDAREKGGSGLGLAISRSLVERLGGRIWAENGPSGGATFRFTLPAAGPEDAIAADNPVPAEIASAAEPGPRPRRAR